MTSTNSPTLIRDSKIWKDQTASVSQKSVPIALLNSNLKHQEDHNHVLHTIEQLADGTNDGGVLLGPGFLLAWMIYLNADNVSRILPKATLKNEMVKMSVGHSLSLKRILVETPPHLDAIQWIENVTGLTQEKIGQLIGVTRQTINWWKRGGRIADDNRKRLFAVREVLERAASHHSNPSQLTAWLDTPRGADGRTPAQLLETNEINRARLLAISTPSPRLVRAPSWVNRPIPEAFRAGAEHRQEVLPPSTDDELAQLLYQEENDTGEDGEVLPHT